MDRLPLRFQFSFYASLIFILFLSNASVSGRQRNYLVKRLANYTNRNYNHYPSSLNSNYQPNFQPSSGNHLYPRLDFSQIPRPDINPYLNQNFNGTRLLDFSNGQIDPGFDPSYYNRHRVGTYDPTIDFSKWKIDPGFAPSPYRINGHNVTYVPDFKFGSVNPTPQPNQNRNQNFSIGWNGNRYQNRDQYVNRHSSGNFSNFNVHNNLPARNLILQTELPAPRTTCGKTLCAYVPNYPTKEISNAVDRARGILRSGATNAVFRNKGITLQNFNSKKYDFQHDNKAAGNRGVTASNACKSLSNAIYPHEGFSLDDSKAYYVVNIPNLDQALTNVECENGGQTCNQRVGLPMSRETRICQQSYRVESLLVLPFGKHNFDIDDFELKRFPVPASCDCMPIGTGY